ncbi:MAG TPA: aminoacyl-tRNA hydrolase [Steroidobacteraceae bacterium]|jgi:PTH1 family peptidyl-tRNA hydrolase|nr:aminoacyl-tRNA hydrolase [Steroidobacteraceae bacterium]
MDAVPLKLIVGLGNPGAEHERQRHNAGFHFVEALAARHGGTFRYEPRHQADLARVRIADSEVWLAKPMTYMNCSGGPLSSVAAFYKIVPAELLVAYDELDFAPGDVRLKFGGGHGGHNGMRDVLANSAEGFWRLRLGIGHPGDRDKVLHYVLGRPSKADEELIGAAIAAAADVVPVMMQQGAQRATQALHARPSASSR